jgi:hypothetical protein
LRQEARFLLRRSPKDVFCGSPLGNVWDRWRLFALVEKLIQGHLKRPGKLLNGVERWNRMTVLNAGNIAADEARALLNVALR